MELSRLGIVVDSKSAAKATSDLDRLGDQAAKTEKQVGRMANTTSASFKRTGATAQRMTTRIQGSGFAVGNLASQLNDIGVTLASGQSPIQIALQQGTQIGQVFTQAGGSVKVAGSLIASAFKSVVSPVNLLTIGVIAAGSALAQWGISALSAGDDAEELEGRVEDARDALSSLKLELRGIRLGISDDEVALLDAIAAQSEKVAEAQARLALNQGAGALGYQQMLRAEEEALKSIEDQLSETRRLAAEKETLKRRTAETADAERILGEQMAETVAQAAETSTITQLLQAGMRATTIQAMELAGIDLANPVVDAETAANLLKLGLTDSQIAAAELAGISLSDQITQAANEAERLANNLFLASRAGLRKTVADEDLAFSQSLDPEQTTNALRNFRSLTAPKKRGRSRSGPSKAEREAQQIFNANQREAEQWVRRTETALESYNRELTELSKLNELGFFAEKPEAYARAVDQLDQEFRESQLAPFQQGIESISDAIADAIVNGEDLGDTMANVLAQIAADIISSNIKGLLEDALSPSLAGGSGSKSEGGLGGIFSSLLGGLFGGGFAKGGVFSGGNVMAFAKGGIVSGPTMFPMARGTGLMGEAGPEAIMPLSRGPDGRLGVRAANQNGPMTVHVTGDFRIKSDNEKFQGEVINLAAQVVNQASPGIVGQSVSASAASAGRGGFDRSMGKRFNLSKKAPAR